MNMIIEAKNEFQVKINSEIFSVHALQKDKNPE